MKTLYVATILAILTAGIFLVLKFGTKPQPVQIMKPSYFSKTEEIGATIYRRFYAPITERSVVFLGIPPQPAWHQGVVRGVLLAAGVEKHPFDAVILEEGMPDLNLFNASSVEVVRVATNSATLSELMDLLKLYKSQNKKVLVVVPSTFSTHLLQGNLVNRIEKISGEPVFSITSTQLALHPNQEILVSPPCVGMARDNSGTATLGCAVLSASRRLYRKDLKNDRYVAIMEQNGAFLDYLLMIAAPNQ